MALAALVAFWAGLWLGHLLTDPVCSAPCCDPAAAANQDGVP